MALATFARVAYKDYTKTCRACLTNLNDLHIFSVPGLRSQNHYTCIWKENSSVISFCVFTCRRRGFYLMFPVGIRTLLLKCLEHHRAAFLSGH